MTNAKLVEIELRLYIILCWGWKSSLAGVPIKWQLYTRSINGRYVSSFMNGVSLLCLYTVFSMYAIFLSARLMPGHLRQIAVISVKIISLLLSIPPVDVMQWSLVCNTFLLYSL